MRRMLRASLGKGISVKVDLVELENVMGARVSELADRLAALIVERCFRKLGLRAEVREDVTYIEVYSPSGGPQHYGFVERELDLIELEVREKMGKVAHMVSMFYSRERLRPIRVAVYVVEEMSVVESAQYRVLGRICRTLRKIRGIECATMGAGKLGIVAGEGIEADREIRVSTDVGDARLVFCECRYLDFSDRGDKMFVKKLIDASIREALRSRGYVVDGLSFYERSSMVEDERFMVRPGVEVQTFVYDNGRISVAVSPRFSVEARGTMDGEDLGSAVGSRARRISDGLSGRVVAVVEVEGRPAVELAMGGFRRLELPSNLVRIFDMRELKKLGASREVLSAIRMSPEKWTRHVQRFFGHFRVLEVAGQSITFMEEMPIVEAL